MCSEKPICAPPHLSEVSPKVAVKRSQSKDVSWPEKFYFILNNVHTFLSACFVYFFFFFFLKLFTSEEQKLLATTMTF